MDENRPNRLTAPDKSALVVGVTSLLIVAIYAYQGHHTFFVQQWGERFAGDPLLGLYRHGWQFAASFVLLGLIPALVWRFGLHRPFAALGLTAGDWRFGLKIVLAGLPVLALLAYLTAGDPAFRAEYPLWKGAGLSAGHFVRWELAYLIYYVGWELHFRGFLQLGLADSLGRIPAMLIQAFPSTLLHIGLLPKPQGETLAAVAAAFIFGAIALRTRSILYVLVLHWAIGAMTDGFCLLRSGLDGAV